MPTLVEYFFLKDFLNAQVFSLNQYFVGQSNLPIRLFEESLQISIFFNNLLGDPFAEFIKSSNFNFVLIFKLEDSK